MTKNTFIKVLEDNDILWNDIVTVTILNPFKKRWEFWKPNMFSFNGALDFTYDDSVVGLCTEVPEDNFRTTFLHFDFEQIISIEKDKKKSQCPAAIRLIQKTIMTDI